MNMHIAVPESCVPHTLDYKNNIWTEYTFQELADWVHLLSTRAQHRVPGPKQQKDLYDAQNYLNMMQAKLESILPNIPREQVK